MYAFDVDPIPKQMTQGFTFTVQYIFNDIYDIYGSGRCRSMLIQETTQIKALQSRLREPYTILWWFRLYGLNVYNRTTTQMSSDINEGKQTSRTGGYYQHRQRSAQCNKVYSESHARSRLRKHIWYFQRLLEKVEERGYDSGRL